jgi:hypothetical protein
MRYVPKETNTEDKKVFWFRQGLNFDIRIILAAIDYPSLLNMVYKAIADEEELIGKEERLKARRRREEY